MRSSSGDQKAREQFAPLVPEFERMYELARLLHRKRQRRGSIDFDLPEPVIEFDAQGAMQSIVRSERSWANRLIEEFMLSANECVASWLQNLDVPSLYRIHEKPEPRRVVEFETVAAGFGYSLGLGPLPVKRMTMKSERREHRGRERRARGQQPRQYEIPEDIAVTPRMYQQLALKIAGKPEERILAHLMLRSLRQARYSEKNEGHFALAAPCYTHFTSPIRRYPDLIVHRIAKAVLASGESGIGRTGEADRARPCGIEDEVGHEPAPLSEVELAGIAYESSQSERRAEDAERELMEWKKVKFMQDRLGDDFDAMILSVTKYGCFVELDSLFIEGLVPIMSLQGDHYTFRENTRQIMGEHSGRRYSMGDRVRVVLDRVDSVQRRLQFSILEEVAPVRLGRPGKAKAKVKSGSGKAHPYIPPKNKVLRKGKQKAKKPQAPGQEARLELAIYNEASDISSERSPCHTWSFVRDTSKRWRASTSPHSTVILATRFTTRSRRRPGRSGSSGRRCCSTSIVCSPGRGKRRSFWWSRCRSTSSVKDRRCPRSTFRLLTDGTRPIARNAAVVYTQEVNFAVGTWLSLVEHSLGVRGVGSSNLPVPTIKINHLQDYPTCIFRAEAILVFPRYCMVSRAPAGSTSLPSLIRLQG